MAKTSKTRSSSKKTSAAKKTTTAKAKAKAATSPAAKAAEAEVPVDRRAARSERRGKDRRQTSTPVAVERRTLERREKVSRRRQIDPTTCERDYTDEELQFMAALDQYKRTSGRMFPTCSEILEVFKGLGYAKGRAAEANSSIAPLDATLPAGDAGNVSL